MSFFTLVFCSFLTVAEIFFILYSLNPHWLKVALGYSWVLDLTLGVGMTVIMLSSASLGGLIMSAVSGAVLSLSLLTMKNIVGYRKYKDGQWYEYSSTINKNNFKKLKDNVVNRFNNLKVSMKVA